MIISKQKLQLIKEQEFKYNEKITSTIDLVNFIREIIKIQNEPQEVIYLLTLNTKNQVISFTEVARGGINFCNLSMYEIFKRVLLSNSLKFILIHNHPSGDVTPSKKDIDITERIKKNAEMLQVQFLDHLIIGDSDFQSCMNM